MIPGAKLVEKSSRAHKRKQSQHSDPVAPPAACSEQRSGNGASGPGDTATAPRSSAAWNAPLPPLDMSQLLAALWGLPNAEKTSAASVRSLQKVQYAQQPSSVSVHRGLINAANACYMNAILQALVSIPPFMQLCCAAHSGRLTDRCPTLSALGKWFADVYSKRGGGTLVGAVCGPRLPPLGSRCGGTASSSSPPRGLSSSFDGMSQQDAHEYLLLLLEACRDELGSLERGIAEASPEAVGGATSERSSVAVAAASGPTDTEKGWITVGKKQQKTVVVSTGRDAVSIGGFDRVWRTLFGGVLATTTKGSKSTARGVASVVREAFISVSLEVETGASDNPKVRGGVRHPNIATLLEGAFSRKEVVQGATGEEREMQRTASVGLPLPHVLLIHLKRWKITAEGELVKLENVVHVERQLIIPAGVLEDSTVAGRERTYTLSAIVAHHGAGSSRGHYVTYIPTASSTPDAATAPAFLLCNDSKVTMVGANAVYENGDTPYLLFYVKK